MAMRPRTFRRLVLAGSLVALLLLGAIGYFVVAPMQERKSIEKLRTTGMSAYEAGDYATAAQSLRRYLRNVNPSPPEELVAFARAQVKVESSSGGHLRAAIGAYRDYLLLEPDDMEASAELLHLFNRTRMWPEARSLAVSMRSKPGIDLKTVLREEITARNLIDHEDPEIGPLFDQLFALGDPDFSSIWAYSEWLGATGSEEEAIGFLDERIANNPDAPGPRVLRALASNRLLMALRSGPSATNELVKQMCTIVGWDLESHAWVEGAEIGSLDLGRMIARVFDLLGRGDLALEMVAKTAIETEDSMIVGEYARRLWWANQDQRLLDIKQETAEVLGFKVLAAERLGESQTAMFATEMLAAIDTDFRAKGWTQFLQAKSHFDQGNPVEARGLLTKAIDTNPMEPTFYLVMGDVQSALGREGEAQEKWTAATKLAMPAIWAEPTLRIVSSLQRTGHLSEAGQVARDLFLRAPQSPRVRFIWLQSQGAMAREGLLDMQQIESAISFSRQLVEYLPENERGQLSTIIAVLLAESGRLADAASELSRTLSSSPTPEIFAKIVELDQYYDLGVVDPNATDTIEIAIRSPYSALGYARRVYLTTNDRDEALAVFAKGMDANTDADITSWTLAKAQFLDAIDDEQAESEWRKLVAKHPENIEILLSALDSDVLGLDIDFVEDTIAKILDLTSSKGRTEPTRLRLARARAIASGSVLTRSKRDKALAIVRSVISSDTKNIKARLMLSNILDMECSPELTGDDRFERDRAGSAAEKLMISRLIAGPVARDYLFRVSQLHVDLGDNEAARQNLLEAYARSAGDLEAQYNIIHELRRAGEFELAIPRLVDLIQRADGSQRVEYQIALARMLGGLNRRAEMPAVLEAIANSDRLTQGQLADLATLFFQTGNLDQASQVVERANEYGLDELETQYVRFQYAKMTGDTVGAEEILQSMVAADPSNIDAWIQLSGLLREVDQINEAQQVLAQALEANPGNEQIEYNIALLSGDRSRINQLVTESETLASSEAKLAMQRVMDFENARSTLSEVETVKELNQLAITFPNMIAVQRYVWSTMLAVSKDYEQIGANAEAASRRLGTDVGLLELATRAYSNVGNWAAVLRTTEAWRGKSIESPIQPDLFAARAAYETKDFVHAKRLLMPYLESSSQKTEDPMHRELLFLYGKVSIAMKEPLDQLAAQFEPIAMASDSFRNSVWLALAAGSLPEYEESVRWIELTQSMSGPETLGYIGDAWFQLARRFPDLGDASLLQALGAYDQWLASSPQNPAALSATGRALRAVARNLGYEDPQRSAYLSRARDLFDQAAGQDPANLNHLFNAAQCTEALQDHAGTIARYRTLMESEDLRGLFAAAVKNNLARALEQSTSDPQILQEALALVREAIDFQEHPAFLGTLGWVELKLGEEGAADTFRRILATDSESLEGWAGLAVALREIDEQGAREALAQIDRFAPEQGLDPSVIAHMSYFGVRIQADAQAP